MKCDRCETEMKIGFVLNSSMRENALYAWTPVADAKSIGFIECHKCPNCGRSITDDEIDNV